MINQLKLGKLPQKIDPRTFQFKKLLVSGNLPQLPDSYDVDSVFTGFSDNNMFGNDQYGDCVMAGRGHMTLRFEDFEQKKLIPITTQEVLKEYFKESHGQDSGLVMLDSLNEWRKKGWKTAGKTYTIYAYAQMDIKNHNEVKYSVFLLRGAYTGFNVPKSAMDQFNAGQPWTVVAGSPIEGGHCVYIVGYNPTGPVCVTWGRKQQMTWEFWDAYFDEAYAVVDNRDSWISAKNDPLNCKVLAQELQQITGNSVTVKLKSLVAAPKNVLQKIFSIAGMSMIFFGVWQMDMICSGPVWGYNWVATDYLTRQVIPRFADSFFQMGWLGVGVNMNIGMGYDICQLFIILGAIITFLALWFWNN